MAATTEFNPMDESSDDDFLSEASVIQGTLHRDSSDSSPDSDSDDGNDSATSSTKPPPSAKKRKKSSSSAKKVSTKKSKSKTKSSKGKLKVKVTKPKSKSKSASSTKDKTKKRKRTKGDSSKSSKKKKSKVSGKDAAPEASGEEKVSSTVDNKTSDNEEAVKTSEKKKSATKKKKKTPSTKSASKKSQKTPTSKKVKSPSKKSSSAKKKLNTPKSMKSDDNEKGSDTSPKENDDNKSKRKVLDEILDDKIAQIAARAGVPFAPGSACEEENQAAQDKNNSDDPGMPQTTDDVDNLKVDERGELEMALAEKYKKSHQSRSKKRRQSSENNTQAPNEGSQTETSKVAEGDAKDEEHEEEPSAVHRVREISEAEIDNATFSTNEDGTWMRRLDRFALYLKETGEMVDMEYLDSNRPKGECVAFGTLLENLDADGGETPTGAKIFKERDANYTGKCVRIMLDVQDWALDYSAGDHSLWLISESAWYKIGGPLSGLRPAPYYVPKFKSTRKLFEACSQVVNVLTELVAAAGKYILSAKIVYDQIWFRSNKGRFDYAPSGSWWSARNPIRARFIDRNGLFIYEQITSLDAEGTKVFQEQRFSQTIRAKAEQFKEKDKKVAENKLKRDLVLQEKRNKAMEQKRARSEAIQKEKEKRGRRIRARSNARKRFYTFLEDHKRMVNYRKDVESKLPLEDLALYTASLGNSAIFKSKQYSEPLSMLKALGKLQVPKPMSGIPPAWKNTALAGGGEHLANLQRWIEKDLESQEAEEVEKVDTHKKNSAKLSKSASTTSMETDTASQPSPDEQSPKLPPVSDNGLLADDDVACMSVDESHSETVKAKHLVEGLEVELWETSLRFHNLLKIDPNLTIEHFRSCLDCEVGVHLTFQAMFVRIARALLKEDREQNLKVLGLETVQLTHRDQVEDQLRTDSNVFDLAFKRNVTRAEKNRCLRSAFEDELHLRVLGPCTWQEPCRELLANQTEACPDLQWLVGSSGDSIDQCDRIIAQLRLFAPKELHLFQNPANLMKQLISETEQHVGMARLLAHLRIPEEEDPDTPEEEINSCYRFSAITLSMIEDRLSEDWYNPIRATSKPVLKGEERKKAKRIAQFRRKGAQEEHDESDRRVPVWDYENSVRVGGLAAPLESQLESFLKKYPEFEVYQGQDLGDSNDPAESERVDRLLGKGGGITAFVRDVKALYVPFQRQVIGLKTIVPKQIYDAAKALESAFTILCENLIPGDLVTPSGNSVMHIKWDCPESERKFNPNFEHDPKPYRPAPIAAGGGDEFVMPKRVSKEIVEHLFQSATAGARRTGMLPVPARLYGKLVHGRDENVTDSRNAELPDICSFASLRDLIVSLGQKDFGGLSRSQKLLFLKYMLDRFLDSEVARVAISDQFDSWYEQRRVQRELRFALRRERVKSAARANARALARLEDLRKRTVQLLDDKSIDFESVEFSYQDRGDSETDVDTDAEAEIAAEIEKQTDAMLESGELEMIRIKIPVVHKQEESNSSKEQSENSPKESSIPNDKESGKKSATRNGLDKKEETADSKTEPTVAAAKPKVELNGDESNKVEVKGETNGTHSSGNGTNEPAIEFVEELQRPELPSSKVVTIRKRVVAARQATLARERDTLASDNFGTYDACLKCGTMVRPIGRDRFYRRYTIVVQDQKIVKLFMEDGAHETGALFSFENIEQVQSVVDVLNPLGTRESQLLMNMKQMMPKFRDMFARLHKDPTTTNPEGCETCATSPLYEAQIKKSQSMKKSHQYHIDNGMLLSEQSYARALEQLRNRLLKAGALETVSWEAVKKDWDSDLGKIANGASDDSLRIRSFITLENELHHMFNFDGAALRRDWDMSRMNRLADVRNAPSAFQLCHRLSVFVEHDIDWDFIQEYCVKVDKTKWIPLAKQAGVENPWIPNGDDYLVYFPEGHIEHSQTLYDNMIERKQIMEFDYSHKAWLSRYDSNEKLVNKRGETPFLCKVVHVTYFKGTLEPFYRIRLTKSGVKQESILLKPESTDLSTLSDLTNGTGNWHKMCISNEKENGLLAIRLAELLRMVKSWLCSKYFLRPVDLKVFPDYTDAVESPMDLSQIAQRVAQRRYDSVSDFLKDIVLIYDNSKKYCTRKYPRIVRAAYEMQSRATRECTKLEEELKLEEQKQSNGKQESIKAAQVGEFHVDIPCSALVHGGVRFLVPKSDYERVLQNTWATTLGGDVVLNEDGEKIDAVVMGCKPSVQLNNPLPWRPLITLHQEPDPRVFTEVAGCHLVNPWEMLEKEIALED